MTKVLMTWQAGLCTVADMRITATFVMCLLASGVVLTQQSSVATSSTAPVAQRFTGDFNAMKQRRLIRVGVAYNRTHYFIDRGVQRGLAYEAFKLFEDQLNAAICAP